MIRTDLDGKKQWGSKSGARHLATDGTLIFYADERLYVAYGNIDPARPNGICAHNVLWKIDWENDTAQPTTTIWRRTEPDMAPHPTPGGYGGNFRMFTADNGRQFGWGGTDRHHNVLLYMRDGDLFRPVAGMINPWNMPYPGLEEFKRNLEAAWERPRKFLSRKPGATIRR